MEKAESILEAVTSIIKLMVDQPESVTVAVDKAPGSLGMHVSVAREDLGKIIGKQGRTARSLRVIVSAMGKGANLLISLDIKE